MPETRILVPDTEVIKCPGCEKTRPASPGIYVCGNCGTDFVVERGETDA